MLLRRRTTDASFTRSKISRRNGLAAGTFTRRYPECFELGTHFFHRGVAWDEGVAAGTFPIELSRAAEEHELARIIFTHGCNSGHAGSCAHLGEQRHRGLGDVPEDQDLALSLYRRACDGGYDPACRGVAELGGAAALEQTERQVIWADEPETNP